MKLFPKEEWTVLNKDIKASGLELPSTIEELTDNLKGLVLDKTFKVKVENLPSNNASRDARDFFSDMHLERHWIYSINEIDTLGLNEVIIKFPNQDLMTQALKYDQTRFKGNTIFVKPETSPEFNPLQLDPTFLQPTGKVVYIKEERNNRVFVGSFKRMKGHGALIQEYEQPEAAQEKVLFVPKDFRAPRALLQANTLPVDFLRDPDACSNKLYIVEIGEWPADHNMPDGHYSMELGCAGDIEAETTGILMENGVDTSDFSAGAIASLPDKDWCISEEEYQKRTDFRNHCVFTIDPSTARDLDDALSCVPLENGNFEVAVHIADVSHFLKSDTELDHVAQKRATTTYLVQRAYPMLPRLLSENLCSLEENQERLSFSVTWELTPDGDILSENFSKSVIKSCARLAYDHCQAVIENPELDWEETKMPKVFNNFSPEDVKKSIQNLQALALKLREKRFRNGALRLDKPKISFKLDEEGKPNDFYEYIIKDSNRLVEDFMLLANQAAARRIYSRFPDSSLLRNHPRPLEHKLIEFKSDCKKYNIDIDISSAGSIQKSLAHFAETHPKSQATILHILCSQPMQIAKYFSSGHISNYDLFEHYALSIPIYTHFTSPIRRYADVIVHRTLEQALKEEEGVELYSSEEIHSISDNCNSRKIAAKKAQEESSKLFMAVYIDNHGPLYEVASVLRVLDRSLDVVVFRTGLELRIPLHDSDNYNYVHDKESKKTVISWKKLCEKNNPSELVEGTKDEEYFIFKEVNVKVTVNKSGPNIKAVAEVHPPYEN